MESSYCCSCVGCSRHSDMHYLKNYENSEYSRVFASSL